MAWLQNINFFMETDTCCARFWIRTTVTSKAS